MEWYNEQRRTGIILLILVLYLLFLVFFLFAYWPLSKKASANEELIRQAEGQIQVLNAKIQNLKTETEQKKPDEMAMKALPAWDNTEELILGLKGIEQKTGTRMQNVSFDMVEGNQLNRYVNSEEPVHETIREVKMNLIVEGTYGQIRAFLQQIQSLERIVFIDSINYGSSTGQDEETQRRTVEISATAFFAPSYAPLAEDKEHLP